MTDIETRGTKVDSGWQDHDGFVGPMQPGTGPRSDPKGEFPTGPEVGQQMPDVQCATADDTHFDLHADRAGRPAVFIFYRSAVW
ncbi:MAG: hypothetical protein V2I41_05360 [Pseudomonadales bacterium]|nr:hypothetical protein [Pseudomonadales bacterium]